LILISWIYYSFCGVANEYEKDLIE